MPEDPYTAFTLGLYVGAFAALFLGAINRIGNRRPAGYQPQGRPSGPRGNPPNQGSSGFRTATPTTGRPKGTDKPRLRK